MECFFFALFAGILGFVFGGVMILNLYSDRLEQGKVIESKGNVYRCEKIE